MERRGQRAGAHPARQGGAVGGVEGAARPLVPFGSAEVVVADPVDRAALRVHQAAGRHKAAERWISSLGAIAGVSTVLTVLQGAGAPSNLLGAERLFAGAALVYALLSSALALFMAVSALRGVRDMTGFLEGAADDAARLRRAEIINSLPERVLRPDRRRGIASVALAFIALGLIAYAVAVNQFGRHREATWLLTRPAAPAASPAVEAAVLCGELEADPATGALRLVANHGGSRGAGATPTPVPVTDAAALESVEDCPDG